MEWRDPLGKLCWRRWDLRMRKEVSCRHRRKTPSEIVPHIFKDGEKVKIASLREGSYLLNDKSFGFGAHDWFIEEGIDAKMFAFSGISQLCNERSVSGQPNWCGRGVHFPSAFMRRRGGISRRETGQRFSCVKRMCRNLAL